MLRPSMLPSHQIGATAAGGTQGCLLGLAAGLYVLAVLGLVYYLFRRVMWHQEQYGLTYQLTKVGQAASCAGQR